MRNEKPEDDQNPMLIKELAKIKYDYYLTTFKEIFNDVIEERVRIVNEERSKISSIERPTMYSREVAQRLNASDLHKSKSHLLLKERFKKTPMSGKGISRKDNSSILLPTAAESVISSAQKTVLLTNSDYKQIEKIR